MTDAHPDAPDRPPADPMAAVDRKLNVFALANGMDLVRRGEARLIGWYRDGMERGIRVEPGAGGRTWALRAWAARDARADADHLVRTLESALEPAQLLSRFTELLAGATEAANALRAEETGGRA